MDVRIVDSHCKRSARGGSIDEQVHVSQIGASPEGDNVLGRDCLQPDSLPYPARGRVSIATRPDNRSDPLLAMRLRASIRRIIRPCRTPAGEKKDLVKLNHSKAA